MVFTNGYYCLEVGEKVTIDIEEFEELISLGDKMKLEDINSSIIYYENALDIYKGTYLEENGYEIWLVPIKNYYRSLYMKTLFKLLDILKERDRYQKIIEVCRKAISYEPQDVNIHVYLIETMLKLGQIKDAISHYEYTSFLLNKEIGSKELSALNNIDRKIQNRLIEKSKTNITNIRFKLEEEVDKGPLYCEFDHFKLLFNMAKRKRNIEEEPVYISLITLDEDLTDNELNQWKKTMTELLKDSLRTGDAFTFWNELQILVLLENVQGDGINIIENRIESKLETLTKDKPYHIKIKSTTVMPQTSLI